MTSKKTDYTDDSSLASDNGIKIYSTKGLKKNIKITTMEDLEKHYKAKN